MTDYIEVKVPFEQSMFLYYIDHQWDGDLETATPEECHIDFFRVQFQNWLREHMWELDVIRTSLLVEVGGYVPKRHYVVKFDEKYKDAALLFKLTFGGAA